MAPPPLPLTGEVLELADRRDLGPGPRTGARDRGSRAWGGGSEVGGGGPG